MIYALLIQTDPDALKLFISHRCFSPSRDYSIEESSSFPKFEYFLSIDRRNESEYFAENKKKKRPSPFECINSMKFEGRIVFRDGARERFRRYNGE